MDRSDEVVDLITLLLAHADPQRGTESECRTVAETVAQVLPQVVVAQLRRVL